MNEHIVLSPVFSYATCAVIILVVALIFIWKEYPFRRQTLLMIPAIILVISAIAGLLLRPGYVTEETAPPTIVLTRNYDRAKADSLLAHYSNATVMLTHDAERYSGAIRTHSFQELVSHGSTIDFILGDGVPDHVLQQLPNTSLHFIRGTGTSGITRLAIPDVILPHRSYEISGRYSNSPGVALVLSGPEGKLDSVHLDGGSKTFSLNLRPAAPGTITYTVTEHTGRNVIQHTFPVVVREPRSLRILIAEHHPTFESLYLKNWLAKTHQVTVRHQLSKGIFRYEHINTTGGQFDRLNSKTLSDIDVLIIDDQTFAKLPESGQREVGNAIKSGLGCLILYRSRDSFQKVRAILPVDFTNSKSDTIHLALDENNAFSIPVAALRPGRDQKLVPLLPHTGTPAGYIEDHFGKVGYSLMTETYPLLLRGDSIGYGSIWTSLIDGVARIQKSGTEIHFRGFPPYRVDQPLQLVIRSRETPELSYNKAFLPVRENELIDNIWTTTLWPDTTGWQEVLLANDSTHYSFYVHPESELSGVESASNSYATMRRHTQEYRTSSTSRRKAIDPVWFYAMFLCGTAWLWVWPKVKPVE